MSNIKPIVGLGSPILREVCTPIEGTAQGKEVIEFLNYTLIFLPNCLGIAAPQINYSVRMFVMKFDNGLPQIVINPIIKKRRGKFGFQEGCMSIPKVYSRLDVRDDIIDVEYYDENFTLIKKRLRGLESVVFQHELDHLNGILFIDHLTPQGREMIQDKLSDIEHGITNASYDMIYPGTDVTQLKEKS